MLEASLFLWQTKIKVPDLIATMLEMINFVPLIINYNMKKNILDLNSSEALDFLLKGSSYCTIDLPSYIGFNKLIKDVYNSIKNKNLDSCCNQVPRDATKPHKTKADFPSTKENVCYKLLSNKDGKYAWRPLQIIHPILYCQLVKLLTKEDNWNMIKDRYKAFYSASSNIECVSIPIVSTSKQSDKAESILNWWQEIEQQSIKLSLKYDCVLITDIIDCYSAIYTHSIPWALHSRTVAKTQRGTELLGNEIDFLIREMVYGQTNGIPQGYV